MRQETFTLSQLEGRGPLLTALGMQDDPSGKILAAPTSLHEVAELDRRPGDCG
ncbi:MAG TPA: hypothetical protein VG322_09180 [Candidatus Acidoferrales bacterium]|nr:hypothetical protein [Candidatus Acidoferrales bacterium]